MTLSVMLSHISIIYSLNTKCAIVRESESGMRRITILKLCYEHLHQCTLSTIQRIRAIDENKIQKIVRVTHEQIPEVLNSTCTVSIQQHDKLT